MAYNSSSLDEPRPRWTAYRPKAGVAWAPRGAHVYDDDDDDSEDDDCKDRVCGGADQGRRRPLGRVGSAVGLSGSLANILTAVTTAVLTPRPARRRSYGGGGATGSLQARTRSEPALEELTRPPRQRHLSNGSPGDVFLRPTRITESRESLPSVTSVTSDGTKSSSESPTGSSRGIPAMWETPGHWDNPGHWDTSRSTWDNPGHWDTSRSTWDTPGGRCLHGRTRNSVEDRFPSDGFLEVEEQSSCGDIAALGAEEVCLTDPQEERRAVDIQDLVCQDVGAIAIDRRNVRTGRLVVRECRRSVCCGSLRSTYDGYTSYTRQVSIHIYRGLNTRDQQVALLQNIAALRKLRHRHVTFVYGVCLEGAPLTPDGLEAMVVTPRAHPHLNLRRLLVWTRENNPKLLTPQICASFGLQMCQGLVYLEKQGVLHSNLTTATVLLDSQCRCKLFEIEIQALEKRNLNTRWLPLETFLQSLYNYKAVVWCFGVVLWEMASLGQEPYPHLADMNDIILYLAHGKRLIRPDHCPRRLYNVMLNCWREKPRSRPTFEDLIVTLTSYKQTLPIGRPVEEVFPDRDEFWEDQYF